MGKLWEFSSSHAQNYFNYSENTRLMGIPIVSIRNLYIQQVDRRITYFKEFSQAINRPMNIETTTPCSALEKNKDTVMEAVEKTSPYPTFVISPHSDAKNTASALAGTSISLTPFKLPKPTLTVSLPRVIISFVVIANRQLKLFCA